jgi:hypothetical protein
MKTKWKRQLIVWTVIVLLSATIILYLRNEYTIPTYEYPKLCTSYNISRINRSADTVTVAMLKAIYKEDVEMFKKCVYMTFVDNFYIHMNKRFDDNNAKGILHEANMYVSKKYGAKWFDKVSILSSKMDDAGLYYLKLKCGSNSKIWNNVCRMDEGKLYVVDGMAASYLTVE